MSGNQDDKTKPVYHSYHSYLFSELEKEFKTKVEGPYVTKFVDEYGAFYQGQISRDQVDALKALVADELMWSRYIYGKPEVGLTPEQGSSIIARFKAKIAKLEEEHADEKKKLQSEHTAAHEAFLKGACQNYSSQIEKLCAENKRLKEENAEVKCLKENLIKNEVKQYDKFEVLLAEKMDLEKDITRKEAKIKGLEDEVAELKKDNAELEKGLAKLGELPKKRRISKRRLLSSRTRTKR
ncbi:hypothetical protein B0H65DRAFT_505454 [Neurospora tetraspora]|uniref:Uncharacterized protein n=1 Tax=Neurospora tetraspora TaxID=94610 RepID=A0AAE0JQ04_9PEZI|nr:hypothetical protein B0H65DRAFT_505454 [Neurospora tetraspora]